VAVPGGLPETVRKCVRLSLCFDETRCDPPRILIGRFALGQMLRWTGSRCIWVDYTEQDTVEKEAKSDAELEDMILQRLLIGGVFVSVRRDPLLGWRPTVITAPKHMRNAQELADTIAADLRKKFTLKE
jgi:hypothetical protein